MVLSLYELSPKKDNQIVVTLFILQNQGIWKKMVKCPAQQAISVVGKCSAMAHRHSLSLHARRGFKIPLSRRKRSYRGNTCASRREGGTGYHSNDAFDGQMVIPIYKNISCQILKNIRTV